ncbi:helix-turn-helix domain-containing protein [Okeania sp.]|nr:helix-turn-helix domain-containing protein [Okeania sp.]MEB3339397.1 helix-turn-helix domain-containing protein [Okeania sp.]
MLLGFKTELHPTNQQKTLLAKHALCSSSCLELGIMAYQKHP